MTAHDGFTLFDLTAFNKKHNLGNGENNRDGTGTNHSFNHGAEGRTDNPGIHAARRKARRNLLGTLLLSAGTPMLSAGDEVGRSQNGNNNAYCHDNELTWQPWELEERQKELLRVTRELIRIRRENPALRPIRFGVLGQTVPSASRMDWFNATGQSMSVEDWNSPTERTLQYLATSTPELEEPNRILLVIHGLETAQIVTLPDYDGIRSYTLLWNSALEGAAGGVHLPASRLAVAGTSMQLLRAD